MRHQSILLIVLAVIAIISLSYGQSTTPNMLDYMNCHYSSCELNKAVIPSCDGIGNYKFPNRKFKCFKNFHVGTMIVCCKDLVTTTTTTARPTTHK